MYHLVEPAICSATRGHPAISRITADAIQLSFYNYLIAEQARLSPHTVAAYRRDVVRNSAVSSPDLLGHADDRPEGISTAWISGDLGGHAGRTQYFHGHDSPQNTEPAGIFGYLCRARIHSQTPAGTTWSHHAFAQNLAALPTVDESTRTFDSLCGHCHVVGRF